MQTKLLRKVVRKFGAVGLLAVGCYLVLHTLWQRRRFRYAALLLTCIGVAALLLLVTHQRHRATIAPLQNDHNLVASLTTLSHPPAQAYTITDLGPTFGDNRQILRRPNCINDSAQIVGGARSDSGIYRAVLWQNAQMRPLSDSRSSANGINNRGWVVGEQEDQAVLWRDGKVSILRKLPNQSTGHAVSINEKGQIVGTAAIGKRSWSWYALLWEDGRVRSLGTLPRGHESRANGLNNRGQVTGWADWKSGFQGDNFDHAFLWDSSGGMQDLGTLAGPDGDFSVGNAINDAGTVVGSSDFKAHGEEGQHAFQWRRGRMEDLGVLQRGGESSASGINNAGDIVGLSRTLDDCRAVLWKHGKILDLNSVLPAGSAWKLLGAGLINNRGQIVGGGMLGNAYHAYLLSPK